MPSRKRLLAEMLIIIIHNYCILYYTVVIRPKKRIIFFSVCTRMYFNRLLTFWFNSETPHFSLLTNTFWTTKKSHLKILQHVRALWFSCNIIISDNSSLWTRRRVATGTYAEGSAPWHFAWIARQFLVQWIWLISLNNVKIFWEIAWYK